MEESLKIFAQQFEYNPEVVGEIPSASSFVLCGMGGSHLQADILNGYHPDINITVHSDYGLVPADDALFIASSYSGNTEEVLDFIERAVDQGKKVVCVATGGKLIEYAQEKDLTYIQMPDTGIQPRSALGFSLLALAKIVKPDLVEEIQTLRDVIKPEELRSEGEEIAKSLEGYVPVVYSSTPNASIAYNWKIKFNETGKVPAFYNVFPELNHNEMQGFDHELGKNFRFIFIRDDNDNVRIQKRMDVCEKLYEERGMEVISAHLTGVSYFERVFNSLLIADWASLTLASIYGTEPEQVPMIEEFKKQI